MTTPLGLGPVGTAKLLFVAPLLAAIAGWAWPAAEAAPAEVVAPVEPAPAEAPLEDTVDCDQGLAFAAGNCTYYSNPSHTVIVGQFGYDCCNNKVSWGKKTQFVECGGCFPCFPPPR